MRFVPSKQLFTDIILFPIRYRLWDNLFEVTALSSMAVPVPNAIADICLLKFRLLILISYFMFLSVMSGQLVTLATIEADPKYLSNPDSLLPPSGGPPPLRCLWLGGSIMIEPAGSSQSVPPQEVTASNISRKRASARRFRFHRPAGIVLITLSMSSVELFFKVLIASVGSFHGDTSP
jgi:hypothetical protein